TSDGVPVRRPRDHGRSRPHLTPARRRPSACTTAGLAVWQPSPSSGRSRPPRCAGLGLAPSQQSPVRLPATRPLRSQSRLTRGPPNLPEAWVESLRPGWDRKAVPAPGHSFVGSDGGRSVFEKVSLPVGTAGFEPATPLDPQSPL